MRIIVSFTTKFENWEIEVINSFYNHLTCTKNSIFYLFILIVLYSELLLSFLIVIELASASITVPLYDTFYVSTNILTVSPGNT